MPETVLLDYHKFAERILRQINGVSIAHGIQNPTEQMHKILINAFQNVVQNALSIKGRLDDWIGTLYIWDITYKHEMTGPPFHSVMVPTKEQDAKAAVDFFVRLSKQYASTSEILNIKYLGTLELIKHASA